MFIKTKSFDFLFHTGRRGILDMEIHVEKYVFFFRKLGMLGMLGPKVRKKRHVA